MHFRRYCCLRIIEQHPLVYKLSSAWDSLTAESDEGIGVRELRRLDPSFSVEDWKRDIQELFLPEFMSAFLRVREETWVCAMCLLVRWKLLLAVFSFLVFFSSPKCGFRYVFDDINIAY